MYQPPPQLKQPEFDDQLWFSNPEEEQPVPNPPFTVTPQVGQYAMEQAIARLLFHTGFEGQSTWSLF